MTLWRTNPALRLTAPKDLAEKIHDLGWQRLSPSEQKRARRLGLAVCAQLGAVKARELAQIIGIVLPVDFKGASDAAILKRGKNALMSKIRATYKAHGVRHTGEIEE